jgi:hypothetical protein
MMYEERGFAHRSARQKKRVDAFAKAPILAMAMLLLTLSAACSADTNGIGTAVLEVNGGQDAKQTIIKNPPSEDAARRAVESQEKLNVPGMSDIVLRAGMDYADFRRAILSKGWVPVVDKQCKSNVDGGNELCEQMPELSSCSVDGYCLMRFHFVDAGQVMEVGAYGDTTGWSIQAKDSQLAVTGVTIIKKSNH